MSLRCGAKLYLLLLSQSTVGLAQNQPPHRRLVNQYRMLQQQQQVSWKQQPAAMLLQQRALKGERLEPIAVLCQDCFDAHVWAKTKPALHMPQDRPTIH